MIQSLKNPAISFLVLILIGVIFYFGFNSYIQLLLLYVLINSILAMSLNLVNGFTGQFSLGHAGFMAVGAYVSAVLNIHVPIFGENSLTNISFFQSNGLQFLNFIIYTTIAGLVAAAFGFIVGQPSLKLKGDYLAIVTLGFGEIIRVVLLNIDFVGGPRGLSGVPPIGSFLSTFSFASFWAIICFFFIWRIIRSSHGRGFLSVREDEVAASAMGVNVTRQKVLAFVISSFFAGVAGSIFAHVAGYINPSTFTFLKSVDAVIMVVLGGMSSLTGSIVAAIIVTALPEVLRALQEYTKVDLRMVIYSLCLILIMIWRPKGIFGELEWTNVWSKYVKRTT